MIERDTQFAGFAELLFNEIVGVENLEDVTPIISRRAYDLAKHVVFKLNCLDVFEHSGYQERHGYTTEEMIAPIPDMTEFANEH